MTAGARSIYYQHPQGPDLRASTELPHAAADGGQQSTPGVCAGRRAAGGRAASRPAAASRSIEGLRGLRCGGPLYGFTVYCMRMYVYVTTRKSRTANSRIYAATTCTVPGKSLRLHPAAAAAVAATNEPLKGSLPSTSNPSIPPSWFLRDDCHCLTKILLPPISPNSLSVAARRRSTH